MSYTKKRFEDLDLIDNFLMDALATDPDIGEDSCRKMISVLLQREVGNVRIVSQRFMPPVTPDHRGIRMDVEIEESLEGDSGLPNMNIYDLEPHKRPRKAEDLPRRNRFYQAKIDGKKLNSGEKNFSKLPNLYIINILDYDPFGHDQVCYTIENSCVEVPGLDYEDGLKFLYFNATGTKGGNEAMRNMLHFIQHSNASNALDESTQKLYDYVSQIKEQPEARERYMSWDADFDYEVDKARAEGEAIGEARGREEERTDNIKKLAASYMSKDTSLSEEEALKMAREILG